MDRTSPPSYLTSALAFIAILSGAACSVPLAPGYRINKQSREVRFVAGQPPELRVSTQYALENSGTADLSFMDVNFPPEKVYGRKELRIVADGHELSPLPLPEEYQFSQPNTLRIPLQPVWMRKEIRDLTVEYAFDSPVNPGERITIGPQDFHLSSRGWPPSPQPPRHALSPYPARPPVTFYTVRVPSNFRVLARGTLAGSKQTGDSETIYRFQLRKDDLAPFVVAGNYVATSPESKDGSTAVFWTFLPLRENAGPAIERITAAWNTLEKDFGPLDRHIHAPHIVEATGLSAHLTGEAGPAVAAFPGGVLANAAAFDLGISCDDFLGRVTHAFAHNWFGDEVFFAPDAAVGMGEGLPEYAAIVIDDAEKGPSGRRERVIQYLREYDEASKRATEKPLGVTMLTDPFAQRRIALAKAPLFFVALEDSCGAEPMHSGLMQMVTLLRGQETSYDALRSALEQSCGKNLAKPFRVWLNDKGIPADFRARYQP